MTFSTALTVVIIALVPGLLALLKAKRLRRLSEARYHMAKAVTAAEKLMTAKAVPMDSLRYQLFRVFSETQFQSAFSVGWNPLRNMDRHTLTFHHALGRELDGDLESKRVVDYFLKSFIKTFRSEHPFKHFALSAWVWFFHGGFRMMMIAVDLLISGSKGIKVIKIAWRQVKQEIAEWSILSAADEALQRIQLYPGAQIGTLEIFAASVGGLWIPRNAERSNLAGRHWII